MVTDVSYSDIAKEFSRLVISRVSYDLMIKAAGSFETSVYTASHARRHEYSYRNTNGARE